MVNLMLELFLNLSKIIKSCDALLFSFWAIAEWDEEMNLNKPTIWYQLNSIMAAGSGLIFLPLT